MATDIHFNKTKGYFDFDIATNGDFVTTQGLDTALLMSIYVDKRAEPSEVPAPSMRRGWWGNLVGNYVNYQIGSKLWLLIQARKDNVTLNLAKTYTYDCLQWLIEDQLATRIEVSDYFLNDALLLKINIYKGQSIIFSNAYTLWNNTKEVQ
jgi:phage gp46-like protein